MTQETIEKVKKVALDYQNPEKTNASRILSKHGVFIDIAGIQWGFKELEKFDYKKRLYLFGFDPTA